MATIQQFKVDLNNYDVIMSSIYQKIRHHPIYISIKDQDPVQTTRGEQSFDEYYEEFLEFDDELGHLIRDRAPEYA